MKAVGRLIQRSLKAPESIMPLFYKEEQTTRGAGSFDYIIEYIIVPITPVPKITLIGLTLYFLKATNPPANSSASIILKLLKFILFISESKYCKY